MTVAQALVRHMIAQTTELGDATSGPLFPGVFAIFGHGNVTCLGHALEEHQQQLPTWRGQNEQGMALAATAYNKAVRRRQIMAATSSIGPGATNMVTAAGVAHSNRIPLLLLAGDSFSTRTPDPVLQQVEHFGAPSTTVNDAFHAVTRYWDRITVPEQILTSLPQAINTMLDPADCGPAFFGLPQDVQAMAFDVPDEFLAPRHHAIVRSRPDRGQLAAAVEALRNSSKPLIIAGGGVHYSFAEAALLDFAERCNIPVVETVAGKASLVSRHPLNCGPIGVTGCESANYLAGTADLVLAIGTRLEDFTTGSWTLFQNPDVTIVGLNACRFDAQKRRSLALIADAREGITELVDALGDWRSNDGWIERAFVARAGYHAYIDLIAAPTADAAPVTYAQVVGAIDRNKTPGDYALAAAGGFPGEVNNGWRADELNSFDCEYGFSCMGYEIAGGWGAKMAMPDREVIVFVGDGSTMMMNSDLYSSVISGHKMIVIICDNGGYAVINRLQINQGGVPFNNLLDDCKGPNVDVRVDFEMLARSQGCNAETVSTVSDLEAAMVRARASDRTYVITLQTHRYEWTEGGTYWEVGVPEVSYRAEVVAAHDQIISGKSRQRRA